MGRPTPPAGAETILDFPARIEPVRNVRSTILVASIDNLKQLGRFDEYVAFVPQADRRALLESVAGSWVPVAAATAHYAACERLGFTTSEQLQMGRYTLERVGGTMVGTAIRMAKRAGATPWLFFVQLQRFWARGYDGGGIAAYKLGPKEARLDLVSFSLCEFPFFRRALAGWVEGITALFCTRVFVRERPGPDGPHSLALRVQWV